MTMNIEGLVRSAARATKLGALKDEHAQSLVRELFRQIRRKIDATSEGAVKVDDLGLFRIRRKEQDKEAQKSVKRVAFQSAREESTSE
jgi:hypothetical protein